MVLFDTLYVLITKLNNWGLKQSPCNMSFDTFIKSLNASVITDVPGVPKKTLHNSKPV